MNIFFKFYYAFIFSFEPLKIKKFGIQWLEGEGFYIFFLFIL